VDVKNAIEAPAGHEPALEVDEVDAIQRDSGDVVTHHALIAHADDGSPVDTDLVAVAGAPAHGGDLDAAVHD
jgi:hypothetical protein